MSVPEHAPYREGRALRRAPRLKKSPAVRGFRRSPLTDSNRRPPPYHGGALPTELRGQGGHSSRASDRYPVAASSSPDHAAGGRSRRRRSRRSRCASMSKTNTFSSRAATQRSRGHREPSSPARQAAHLARGARLGRSHEYAVAAMKRAHPLCRMPASARPIREQSLEGVGAPLAVPPFGRKGRR